MRMSQGEKAFNAGKRAAKADKLASTNPYPANDSLHYRWRDGWCEGNSESFYRTGWSR